MNYKTHKNSYIFTVVLALCMMLAACSDYLYDENGGKLTAKTAYSCRAISHSSR